jgi:hypothetical protein
MRACVYCRLTDWLAGCCAPSAYRHRHARFGNGRGDVDGDGIGWDGIARCKGSGSIATSTARVYAYIRGLAQLLRDRLMDRYADR